jgi:hypothetical protein
MPQEKGLDVCGDGGTRGDRCAAHRTGPGPTQLDFWVGKWKCEGASHAPDGKVQPTKGTNEITKDMDGHVVHEHFSMGSFKGESWSVYAPKAKKWRQTWVDNSGAYIALVGEFSAGRMVLETTGPNQPAAVRKRMVFSDIKKDSFDWNWEATQDNGKTWNLEWHLHYTRTN